ncbi:hypothetical protein JLT2_26 [Paraglaciecola Antarctic JLT virus 2]|nr:hypothetical protein JLT2_26 [Paraglaciecola Antarctic JLT virus 2]
MASITLAGTLLDPNGDLAVGDQIRFTHNSTTGQTVRGAVSVVTINPAGTYTLPLQFGLVLVEYKDARNVDFKNLGVATVNSSNTATSIPELLNALVPVSSAELIEFQSILSDAVAAKTAAEAAQAGQVSDLSIDYIFATVAAYKASAIVFPVEKKIHLSDRKADFRIITGTGTGNDSDIIASNTVSQSVELFNIFKLNAIHLGCVAGVVTAAAKLAVTKAIKYSNDNKVQILFNVGRYPSPTAQTDEFYSYVNILGSGRPAANSTYSKLDEATGTVFEGLLSFAGTDGVTLDNFGVDVGLDFGGAASDALTVKGRLGTTPDTVSKNLFIERVTTLLQARTTPNHGILIQGIDGVQLDKLHNIHGFFGTVAKAQNVNFGLITGYNIDQVLFYAKSDINGSGGTYGLCKNVTGDTISYLGNGDISSREKAFYAHASESTVANFNVENVTIDKIISEKGGYAMFTAGQVSLPTNVKNVTVNSIVSIEDFQGVAIGVKTQAVIGNLHCKDPARGVIFESSQLTSNVSVDSITGSVQSGAAVSNLDIILRNGNINSIDIQSANTRPTIDYRFDNSSVGRMRGLKGNLEVEISPSSGYVIINSLKPRVIAKPNGFKLVGNIGTEFASTQTKLLQLPANMLATDSDLYFTAPYFDGTNYTTTIISLKGSDLFWENLDASAAAGSFIDISCVDVVCAK